MAIIGIDGAGKTTQTSMLIDWLRASGVLAVGHPNQSVLPLRAALAEIAQRRGLCTPDQLVGRRVMKLLIATLKWNTLRRIPDVLDAGADVVIADRYSYCQIAGAKHFGLGDEALVRELFACVPTPDLTLYLDVKPLRALQRMTRGDGDVVQLDDLLGLREAYLALPEAADYVVVDANASPRVVHRAVRAHVAELLDGRRREASGP